MLLRNRVNKKKIWNNALKHEIPNSIFLKIYSNNGPIKSSRCTIIEPTYVFFGPLNYYKRKKVLVLNLFFTSFARWSYAPLSPFHVTSKTDRKRVHDGFYYTDFKIIDSFPDHFVEEKHLKVFNFILLLKF